MLAIEAMGDTVRLVFYAVALVLFVLAGIGFKPVGDRVHFVGLGLGAFTFPVFWDLLALQ
jgi:hypothetical protein